MESGYYWVKFTEKSAWEIAFYTEKINCFSIGFTGYYDGAHTIHPQRIMPPDEIKKPDQNWVCNQCNSTNFTESVPKEEIENELHACIKCGGFEFHLENVRS